MFDQRFKLNFQIKALLRTLPEQNADFIERAGERWAQALLKLRAFDGDNPAHPSPHGPAPQ